MSSKLTPEEKPCIIKHSGNIQFYFSDLEDVEKIGRLYEEILDSLKALGVTVGKNFLHTYSEENKK
jgi:hypothetical protein